MCRSRSTQSSTSSRTITDDAVAASTSPSAPPPSASTRRSPKKLLHAARAAARESSSSMFASTIARPMISAITMSAATMAIATPASTTARRRSLETAIEARKRASASSGSTIPRKRTSSAVPRAPVANWRSLRSISAPSTSGGTSFATFGAIAFSPLITTTPASARSSTIDPRSRSKMSVWTFRAACLKIAWKAPVSSAACDGGLEQGLGLDQFRRALLDRLVHDPARDDLAHVTVLERGGGAIRELPLVEDRGAQVERDGAEEQRDRGEHQKNAAGEQAHRAISSPLRTSTT